ncbi:hypothetical protein [Corticibacter populi]|uniref:hypothetical protein n=1 Tax=Corticibacter populi TaxID=1550736 RepID=UPI0010EAB7B7|nr:hypothetical protein [Corticibacter populi]RZS35391.1 integrating conjugative element protein (TIGR03759 family) [Corticibacter populi]
MRLTTEIRAAVLVVLWTTTAAWSQQVGNKPIAATEIGARQQAATQAGAIQLDDLDQLQAQFWGLSTDEMRRAKLLMQGPRAAFSVENISPVEVLGIHARSADERRKYAEKFAKALREDVERSLAWEREFQGAMQRLYPNSPMVDFSAMPPVEASTTAADMLNVPRDKVIDPQAQRARVPVQASQADRNAGRRAIEQLQRR